MVFFKKCCHFFRIFKGLGVKVGNIPGTFTLTGCALFHFVFAHIPITLSVLILYLFPLLTIHPIAVFVPFFELLCGAALIMGVFPRGAVMIINAMLLMFIFSISINLARGHDQSQAPHNVTAKDKKQQGGQV